MKTLLLNALEFTLPAFWQDYLIKQDSSGISLKEKTEIDAWLKSTGMPFPVNCTRASWFAGRNDANDANDDFSGGIVKAFTFLP